MEESHPNWKTVPVEILHKTFQLVDKKTLREIALVCKAWTHAAQAVLYQTVHLRSLWKLKSFCNSVEHRPNLGKNVKSFSPFLNSVPVSDPEDAERKKLITILLSSYLPNIEAFGESSKTHYLLTMNALLDSQLTRLKSLKKPSDSPESSEVANYTTCALLMKDRLEELHIHDRYDSITDRKAVESYYDRLYDKLHQFDKLGSLDICKKTNKEVQMLEYITESCKVLKEIKFNFIDINNRAHPQASRASFKDLKPRTNIKLIDGYVNSSGVCTVIPYIIRKFPQLQKFSLGVRGEDSIVTDADTINDLFKLMSEIEFFDIHGLRVDPNTGWDIVGNRLAASSNPGSESVTFSYLGNYSPVQSCSLSFDKKDGFTDSAFIVRYPTWERNWVNLDFVKKNGKYLQGVRIEYSNREFILSPHDPKELPDDFMRHIIAHCPNLKKLYIDTFILRRHSYFKMDLHKKLSLDKFVLQGCVLYPGALEQLSICVPYIGNLEISCGLTYSTNTEDGPTALNFKLENAIEIFMPHTTIDSITIYQDQDEPIYVQIHSLKEKKSYFYYCDFMVETDDYFKRVTEKEFYNKSRDTHVYICSKTKPELDITI